MGQKSLSRGYRQIITLHHIHHTLGIEPNKNTTTISGFRRCNTSNDTSTDGDNMLIGVDAVAPMATCCKQSSSASETPVKQEERKYPTTQHQTMICFTGVDTIAHTATSLQKMEIDHKTTSETPVKQEERKYPTTQQQ